MSYGPNCHVAAVAAPRLQPRPTNVKNVVPHVKFAFLTPICIPAELYKNVLVIYLSSFYYLVKPLYLIGR